MRPKKEAAILNHQIKTEDTFSNFFVILRILCFDFTTTFNPLFGSSL